MSGVNNNLTTVSNNAILSCTSDEFDEFRVSASLDALMIHVPTAAPSPSSSAQPTSTSASGTSDSLSDFRKVSDIVRMIILHSKMRNNGIHGAILHLPLHVC